MGTEADFSYKGCLGTIGMDMWVSLERDNLFDWLGMYTGISLIGSKLEERTKIRDTVRF